MFIGRTDAEAETPILWPTDVKNRLTGKDSDAGKDWRQEEKEMTEDEMAGWHHRLDGHEFEQVLRVGDGHGSLACCSPWGLKQSDTTEWLNNKKSPEMDRRAERLWLKSFSEMTGFYTCLAVNYHVIIPSCHLFSCRANVRRIGMPTFSWINPLYMSGHCVKCFTSIFSFNPQKT